MKKLLLLCTLAVFTLHSFAQTTANEDYDRQAAALGEQLNAALAQKDYTQAQQHCKELLQLFGTLEGMEYEHRDAALSEKLQTAVTQKDYVRAEQLCGELLRLFDAQSEATRQEYSSYQSYAYYNLACAQSLQGKRKAAVKSFIAACDTGYEDCYHIAHDTDLDNIRNDKTFRRRYQTMREAGDYLYILQHASGYAANAHPDTLPHFTYMSPSDPDLIRVREYFKLDSVAGSGDELSKILNILTYVHNKILHDGMNGNPVPMNAIAMAEACKDGSRGLNCRGLAAVLNECYLSMGFKSRFVTCMPKVLLSDCHVINVVYSETLGKWLWVDPSFNAWVMDENGTMLGIGEVRERLRDGRPVVLNKDANWNNQQQTVKEWYLDVYMAKNLYYVVCTDRSEFGTEVCSPEKTAPQYIALCPEGYTCDYLNSKIRVFDDAWFWQSPDNK